MHDSIGYKIGYLIIVLIAVVLLYGSILGIYKVGKNIWLLSTLESVDAQVTACDPEYFRRQGLSRGLRGGSKAKYAPIVRTSNGNIINGYVYVSRESCNKLINQNVTVLIGDSEGKGYIVTFIQFWLAPLALIVGTLVPNIIFGYLAITKAIPGLLNK